MKKNTSAFLLLGIIAAVLLISILLNNSKSEGNVLAINSNYNKYFKPLPNALIQKVKQAKFDDSLSAYGVSFDDNTFERTLTIIKKNPIKREFLNKFKIRVYPSNPDQYKSASNFLNPDVLSYDSSIKPIMYRYGGDNYSVLKVSLPQINIDKIYINQPGLYKNTFENTFFDSVTVSETSLNPKTEHLYVPVLHQLFRDYNISYLPFKDEKAYSFLTIDAYAEEHSKAVSTIKRSADFWRALADKSSRYKSHLKSYGSKDDVIVNKIKSFVEGTAEFSSTFNTKKLAQYYAILNLCSDNKDNEIGLEYNASDDLIEPVYLNTSNVGVLNNYVKNEHIKDQSFLFAYTKALKTFSNISLEDLFASVPNFSSTIKSLNQKNPTLLFESSVLSHNQLVLQKGINPSTAIKAELLAVKDNKITVSVINISDFPVTVVDLNHRTKKHIVNPEKSSIIPPNSKDSLVFNLPRSFENLFVHKKSKTSGFIFEKDIFALNISYKVGSINDVYHTSIIPYQPFNSYNKKNDLFRSKVSDVKNLGYLKIDEASKTIEIVKNFKLSTPLIFPGGYTIKAGPGIKIDIVEGGKIISYSPLQFIGSKSNRINIISSDKEGQGLLVIGDGQKSNIKYLNFDGLTNPSHGMWSTTSAVTFYEAPVDLDYIKISNNTCEDAINVVRAHFKLSNSQFNNTQSDAFDGDFVTGIINSCIFKDLGNDAIDVSGSDLNISNVKIINAGDKALSAGEDSQMKAQKVTIDNCAIAVAGKDLSIVTLRNLTIKNTKLGFTAFQKKPEFGPSNITATQIVMEDVETKYLIEDTSSLLVDGKKIETEQNVKDRMYGAEFGKSSSETRVRKRE